MNEDNEKLVKKLYDSIIIGLYSSDKEIYEYDIQLINQESKELYLIVDNNYLLINKLNVKKFYLYSREKLLKLSRKITDLNEIEYDSLSLCVLLINPNFTTAWSTRKSLIDSNRYNNKIQSIIQKEFYINNLILKKNFKCEQAYQHRRWLIKFICSISKAQTNQISINDKSLIEFLQSEIDLIKNLSKKLKQNYYCWTYFNWLLNHFLNLDLIQKILKDKDIIYENPSDFSVLHSRLHLIDLLIKNTKDIKIKYDVLINELELCDDLVLRYSFYSTIWNYRKYFLTLMNKYINQIDIKTISNDINNSNFKLAEISQALFSKIVDNQAFHDLTISFDSNFSDSIVNRELKLCDLIIFLYESNQFDKSSLVKNYSISYLKFIQKFIK